MAKNVHFEIFAFSEITYEPNYCTKKLKVKKDAEITAYI